MVAFSLIGKSSGFPMIYKPSGGLSAWFDIETVRKLSISSPCIFSANKLFLRSSTDVSIAFHFLLHVRAFSPQNIHIYKGE